MSGARWSNVGLALALLLIRGVPLLLGLQLSFHHATRWGYWSRAGFWNYGLVLVDPRVPAALLWSLLLTLWLGWAVDPLARWMAARLPKEGAWQWATLLGLALGMGTRGLVAPLLWRAAVAAPVVAAGLPVESLLTHPQAARAVVALCETTWLLPLLILLHLAGGERLHRLPKAAKWSGLALFSLLHSADAAYLLTAGGPRGATHSLSLIALQEGVGRDQLGYGAALTVVLAMLAMAGALQLARRGSSVAAKEEGVAAADGASVPWLPCLLAALPLCVLVVGWSRNAPASLPASPWASAGLSLLACALAGGWTAVLAVGIGERLDRCGFWIRWMLLSALCVPSALLGFSSLRFHLPPGMGAIALVLFAPGLPLAVLVGWLAADAPLRRRWLLPALTGAWVAWSEWLLPVLLHPRQQEPALLPAHTAWRIATVLEKSPLSTEGWPLLWLAGTLLAWGMVGVLIHADRLLLKRAFPGTSVQKQAD